jgi:hypothetical protein
MRYIKIILLIIVAGNLFSLLQKAETVSAFSLSVKSAETIFCNTGLIGIAVFIYLVLKVKVR